jgi:hypothetical protein
MRQLFSFTVGLTLVATAAPLPAQDKLDPAARAERIAPFIDEQTLIVQHADLTAILPGHVFDLLTQAMPQAEQQLAKPRQMSTALHRQLLENGVFNIFSIVSLADVPHDPPFVVVPLHRRAQGTGIKTVLESLGFESVEPFENALVAGSKRTLERLKQVKPQPRPELASAFDAVAGTAAQALLLPTADSRRVIEGMLPTLPAEIGGGPSTIITQGMLWVALGIDAAPEPSLTLVIQSQDAQAARALEEKLTQILQMTAQAEQVRAVLPKVDDLIRLLTPKADGDQLKLALNRENKGVAALLQAIAPPVQAARAAASRAQSVNNLKQIALAMHNYHDTYGRFPAATSYDAQGRPLLSWRVHILPFLEAGELYKEFRLDEPWDSEHNRKLIEKMPEVLRSPSAKPEPGRTTYLVPVGDGTLFDGPEGTQMREIVDGTSNTIMAVEVDVHHSVIWTKPEDLPFDSQQPERGLGGPQPGGFAAAICDGSVLFIKLPEDAAKLRARFTVAGQEVLE